MNYDDFKKALFDIVEKGNSPCVACTICNYKWVCLEGSVDAVYEIYMRGCDKCHAKNIFMSHPSEDYS